MEPRQARTIAAAIARTGVYYRRTGLVAGFAALGGCGLTLAVEFAAQKVASIVLTVVFAIASYWHVRLANRYVDASASPVIEALARDPGKIVKVFFERRPGSALARLLGIGGGAYVVLEHEGGKQLSLRFAPSATADEVRPLLESLAVACPTADVDLTVDDPG
jgi:hypothetical protein